MSRNNDHNDTPKSRARYTFGAALQGCLVVGATLFAQTAIAPTNDLPNPYATIADFFKLPAGRTWGSTSAVDIDKDGKTIWVGERCGLNTCANSPDVDPILHFD